MILESFYATDLGQMQQEEGQIQEGLGNCNLVDYTVMSELIR